jgi:hypothetical protein
MMNIEDIKGDEAIGDKLEFLLSKAESTLAAYERPVVVNIHSKEGQELLRHFAWSIVEELGEAMNCLKNRAWTKNETRVDTVHFDDEVADVTIFFLEWLKLAGYDPVKLVDIVTRKMKVNEFRRRSNY